VVLDRSGSMSGDRLEAANRGLRELVARLDPKDPLRPCRFEQRWNEVSVPCRALSDREACCGRAAAE
jgi:Ca-activated chloride channel family protein